MEKIDLHLHTNISDGILSPNELIEKCINVGCSKIAITDHDKINDYSELSKTYGIPIINGIEFNCSTQGMHILGYGISEINKVQQIMNDIEKENEKVCYKVIDALYNSGYDISVEKILDYMSIIGIKITSLNKKHIVKYLIYKQYVKSVLEAYDSLIGVNQRFYYPIKKLSKQEVINIIKNNGGVPVLAHPSTLKLDNNTLEKEISHLITLGLEGIEVNNTKNTNIQNIILENIVNKYSLITTVGSDFHIPEEDIIGVDTSEEIYEQLQKKMKLAKKICYNKNI